MLKKLLAIAHAMLGTNQSSKPGKFDLADLGYTLKVAAVVGLAAGGVAALGVVDAHDFGVADAVVSGGIVWCVAAIEAWAADNS